jgi:hypothetical protein
VISFIYSKSLVEDRMGSMKERVITNRQYLRMDSQSVLTDEQRDAGLYLEEDEHFLYLYSRDGRNAVFSSQGATIKAIREEADRLLYDRVR